MCHYVKLLICTLDILSALNTCGPPEKALLSDLLMSDGGLLLIGQLHQRAHVCTQVSLAANEEDACAGAEVQDFSLPLLTQDMMTSVGFL